MIIYKLSCINCQNKDEFGINAFENGMLVKSVERITENKTDMEKLVDMCNELKIELCHLDYVIEDYLTDFSLY